MYKRLLNADTEATLYNGAVFRPIATLADEWGGRAQIAIDDLCYVLRLKQPDGTYKNTPYWFSSAVQVMHRLPLPDLL